jgi:hypothetical protein
MMEDPENDEDIDSDDSYEEDYEYYEDSKIGKPPRQYGNVLGTIVVIVIIILLLLLATNAGFREALGNLLGSPTVNYREYPEWADFTVDRHITIAPDPPGSVMSYTVDIPKPKDIPEDEPDRGWVHDVKSIIADPDRTEVKYPENSRHYEWMVWQDSGISYTRSFTIRYSIRTESIVWSLDSSESGTVNDIPKWISDWYGNKTQTEWVIMPTHPDIMTLSDQLTSGKATVYDQLWSIFEYINKEFTYETFRTGAPKFCYETLMHKSGDCDDQSVLFVSLARAAGLPAWLEFGALYNYQEETWGGHAWIRVWVPYYDQTETDGFWYNIDIVNDQFLFRDAYRFTEWESDGDGDHLREYYYSNGTYFSYQESYETISMDKSSQTIKIGEDGRPVEGPIPGFEAIVAVPAILIVAFTLRRKKRLC